MRFTMNKIGTTQSGTVVVELTADEFDALTRLQSAAAPVPTKPEPAATKPSPVVKPAPPLQAKTPPPTKVVPPVKPKVTESAPKPQAKPTEKPVASEMSPKEIAEYVKDRLPKHRPTTKAKLVHSIETMFNFRGGIEMSVIEKVIGLLQKEKFLSIDAADRVSYQG